MDAGTQQNEVLSAALRYAEMGLAILPLKPGQKIPDCAHGVHDASKDPERIRGWFEQRPDRNIGIALKPSHLVAIDIDTHGGFDGHDTIERIESDFGSCEAGWIQETPSGGEHRFFLNPGEVDLEGKFYEKSGNVDLKSDGYVVVYPSTRTDCSGQRYEWSSDGDPFEGAQITAVPGWIIQRFSKKKAAQLPSIGNDMVGQVTDYQWAELQSALRGISSEDRDTWLRVGFALHSTGRPDARAIWDAWSMTCAEKYSDEGQEHAWRSFRNRGWDGIGYRSIFKKAQENGWTGISSEEAAKFKNAPVESGAPTQVREGKKCPFRRYSEVLEEARRQRWIIKHWLPSDAIGVLYGASGAGKSWIAVDMALHIATGLQWCGEKTQKAPVLYVAAEGGTGLATRVEGWRLGHRGVSVEDINENFILAPTHVDMSAETSASTPVPTAEDLKNWLNEGSVQPGLIVIDTLSQTLTGDENAASDIAKFMNNLGRQLREIFHCCVLIIHHAGKGNFSSPRGSSAIQANTSFLYSVSRENKEPRCTLSCAHMKDGIAPQDTVFEWQSIVIGKDADGEDQTSVYLVKAGGIDPKGSIASGKVPWEEEDARQRVTQIAKHVEEVSDAVKELAGKGDGSALASEVRDVLKEKGLNNVQISKALKRAIDTGVVSKNEDGTLLYPPVPF